MSDVLGQALAAMAKQALLEALRDDVDPARRTAIKVEYNRLVTLVGKTALAERRGDTEEAAKRLSEELDSWDESDESWSDSDVILDLQDMLTRTYHRLEGEIDAESREED